MSFTRLVNLCTHVTYTCLMLTSYIHMCEYMHLAYIYMRHTYYMYFLHFAHILHAHYTHIHTRFAYILHARYTLTHTYMDLLKTPPVPSAHAYRIRTHMHHQTKHNIGVFTHTFTHTGSHTHTHTHPHTPTHTHAGCFSNRGSEESSLVHSLAPVRT